MHLITAACIGMALMSHDCRCQEDLGCYADYKDDRLLPTLGENSDPNAVHTCIDICKSKGKTYASFTTPYSTNTSTEKVSSTDNNVPSTTDYTDASHNTTGIAVGVVIALLLMLVVIAVVLVCFYRGRQRKESRDAVMLPDDLYGEVDMEAKAACQRKRQEEDGDAVDKEGNTVVDNGVYGSVSNNSYPFEKEDTFGYVNVASKPPGWKKKNGKAAPVEPYTMDDARCEPDARQKQPVQSDMETVVDNALYGSPDAEDGGRDGFHGDEDGKFTNPVEPLYDTPKRQSIAL